MFNKRELLNAIKGIVRHNQSKKFLTEGALNWFLSVFCEAGLK